MNVSSSYLSEDRIKRFSFYEEGEITLNYLYILSEKNDYDFLYENKINEHYKKCGFCFLCKKYNNYRARYKREFEDDEKEKLLNDKRDKINDRTSNYHYYLIVIVVILFCLMVFIIFIIILLLL